MKAMNPSTNNFLAKDEDDVGDTYHQTCTFIGHRVCNPLLDSQSSSGPQNVHTVRLKALKAKYLVALNSEYLNLSQKISPYQITHEFIVFFSI